MGLQSTLSSPVYFSVIAELCKSDISNYWFLIIM